MTNVEQVTSGNSMLDAFNKMQKSTEMTQVIKELFDPNKIHMIGDLSKDQIKMATRILMIAELKDIPSYKQGLNFFITLMISNDRKSRREIIQAIAGFRQQERFLDKMNPFKRDRSPY